MQRTRRQANFSRTYDKTGEPDYTSTKFIFDEGTKNTSQIELVSPNQNELKSQNGSFFGHELQNSFASPIQLPGSPGFFSGFREDWYGSKRQTPINSHSDSLILFNSNPSSPVANIPNIPTPSGIDLKNEFLIYLSSHPEFIPLDSLFQKLGSFPKYQFPSIARDVPYSPSAINTFLGHIIQESEYLQQKFDKLVTKINDKPPEILKDLKIESPKKIELIMSSISHSYHLYYFTSLFHILESIQQIKSYTFHVSSFINDIVQLNSKAYDKFMQETRLPRELKALEEEKRTIQSQIEVDENLHKRYGMLIEALSFSVTRIEQDGSATIVLPNKPQSARVKSSSSVHADVGKWIRDQDYVKEIDSIGREHPVLEDPSENFHTMIFKRKSSPKIRFMVSVQRNDGYPWTKFKYNVKVVNGNASEINQMVQKAFSSLKHQRYPILSFSQVIQHNLDQLL